MKNLLKCLLGCIDCILVSIWKIFAQKKEVYDVCILRLDAIGDFFIWLDSAFELQRCYSGKKIFLIANAVWAELAKNIGGFEYVMGIDPTKFRKNFMYRQQLLARCVHINTHLLLSPTCSRTWELDILAYAIFSQKKITVDGDDISLRKRITKKLYDECILIKFNSQMELISNADFVRSVANPNFKASIPDLAKKLNWKKNISDYCIIFPGASRDGKQWQVEKFAEVAKHFSIAQKLKIFICGGKREEKIASSLQALLEGFPVEMLCGKTTLEELMKIILDAKFLVSNDTVAVHIAQVLDTPSFCIASGRHFRRFMPYITELTNDRNHLMPIYHEMPCFGCVWTCIYGKKSTRPCITAVETQNVIECIQKYFA